MDAQQRLSALLNEFIQVESLTARMTGNELDYTVELSKSIRDFINSPPTDETQRCSKPELINTILKNSTTIQLFNCDHVKRLKNGKIANSNYDKFHYDPIRDEKVYENEVECCVQNNWLVTSPTSR